MEENQISRPKNFWMKKIFKILKIAIFTFFVFSIVGVLFYSFLPVYITPLIVIRSIEKISKGQKPKVSHIWVKYDAISPHMKLAVIAGEDQNFVNHNGFDFKMMKKAFEQNKKKKRIKGASTISQQTAKNVFLWPNRNYLRKALEAYFTILIETLWSKKRILEVYLNVIETGDGIYGVEAAARHYFKKSAKTLTKEEAAAIAASLPNPRRYNPNKPTNFYLSHKQFILKYMNYVEAPK